MKQFYAYYTRQLFNEFDRIRTLNGKRHKDRVVKLSQNYSDLMSDVKNYLEIINLFIQMHVIWADILSYYTESIDNSQNEEIIEAN